MTLEALHHLLRASRALAEDRDLIILGSSSLLVSFPELGEEESPLASTYDADLLPDPFDELTGRMLQESLGGEGGYHLRHGYHADILRDSIMTTLPEGWRGRLVEVPGFAYARALEPSDLAATKLWVGRPKDLDLVGMLAATGRIEKEVVEDRVRQLPVQVELLPRISARFRGVLGEK